MPTTKKDLPGTLKRSPAKAQRTYAETLDSAEEQYDSEARAHRTAWSAVKHSFEKVGDHWEAKDQKGPSDPQSAQRGTAARNRPERTHGGVDVRGNTKEELYERARKAGVKGRSSMSKGELADALARKQG
jgi:cation transport regulator ChaB